MIKALLGAAVMLAAAPAAAMGPISIRTEALSDLRERGLSQTGGRAAAALRGSVDIGAGLAIDGSAYTARGSDRHGGADLGGEVGLNHRSTLGAVTLDGGVVGRFFPGGAGALDYVEGYATASFLIGPAELGASAFYAPSQDAIGGSNLYLRARTRLAVVGTPVSVTAHVGRSSGDMDDAVRAARLRPGGRYVDWGLGADYTLGPATLGVLYSDTDIDPRQLSSRFADAGNNGARLSARVALSF